MDQFAKLIHPYLTMPLHMPNPIHHQYQCLYAYLKYIYMDLYRENISTQSFFHAEQVKCRPLQNITAEAVGMEHV